MTDTAPPRWAEYRPLAELPPATRNAKNHDEGALARSVSEFGFIEPVVLDERTGKLLAGHGRVEHLTQLEAAGAEPPDGVMVGDDGRWQVLTVRGAASRDDLHAEAMGIALNRVGERGGWQVDVLVAMLDDIIGTPIGEATGFTADELDELVALTTQGATPGQVEPGEQGTRHVEFDAKKATTLTCPGCGMEILVQ